MVPSVWCLQLCFEFLFYIVLYYGYFAFCIYNNISKDSCSQQIYVKEKIVKILNLIQGVKMNNKAFERVISIYLPISIYQSLSIYLSIYLYQPTQPPFLVVFLSAVYALLFYWLLSNSFGFVNYHFNNITNGILIDIYLIVNYFKFIYLYIYIYIYI